VTRLSILLCLILFTLISRVTVAQDTNSDTDTVEDGSTINFFFVACENQAVFNLDGNMEPGFDIFIQVFDTLGGGGNPLSNVLRVPVDGPYQVSQTVPYNNGTTLLLGQSGSASISIARENAPSDEIFSTIVDDSQDGCAEPAFETVDTLDASTSGLAIDPVTGEAVEAAAGEVISSSGIFTPDGGVLNEVVARASEPVVQIGARPSDRPDTIPGRVSDPGLIFAECDAFAGANPGVLFDTDNLTVFWSWFATTPDLVRDHIAQAQYEVFLISEFAGRQPFPDVVVSPVVQREDGNFWVFYTANLGDGFKPGTYQVSYFVSWAQPISDGLVDFGPGTENEGLFNTCTFTVEPNPFDIEVNRKNPTVPLQR